MTVWRAFGAGREQPSFDNERPDSLIKACQELTDATSPSLSVQAECSGEWAERWFGLLDFARVGAMYDGENFATLYEPHDRAVDVTQLCVDATTHIRKCMTKARAYVLFFGHAHADEVLLFQRSGWRRTRATRCWNCPRRF